MGADMSWRSVPHSAPAVRSRPAAHDRERARLGAGLHRRADLAAWGISALRWLGGDAFGLAEITMNWRVLVAESLTAFVAPLGFGLLPALRSQRRIHRNSGTARAQPESPSADAARQPGRSRLQAGAAMILMVQIGLLVRTTWTLSQIAPGFDPAQVLTFRVGLPESRKDTGRHRSITHRAADRLRALPGVTSVGLIDRLPVADREPLGRLTVEGTPPGPTRDRGPRRPLSDRRRLSQDDADADQTRPSVSAAEMSDAAPGRDRQRGSRAAILAGPRAVGARIALERTGPEGLAASRRRRRQPSETPTSIRARCRRSTCHARSRPRQSWRSS